MSSAELKEEQSTDRIGSSDAVRSRQTVASYPKSKRLRTDCNEDREMRSHGTNHRGKQKSETMAGTLHMKGEHSRSSLSKSEGRKFKKEPGLEHVQKEDMEEIWVCRDLTVKVVDRRYKKGKYYNTLVSYYKC